jgi:hypothetical protein
VSLRSDIADFIRARVGIDYQVLPYQRELDNAAKPVVLVHRREINRIPGRHAWIEHAVAVHVLVPEAYGKEAEDAADTALSAVLTALQDLADVEWSKAERANYSNFVGYEVTLTAETPSTLI